MRGKALQRPQGNRVETRDEGIVGGTGDGIEILNVRLSGEMVSWLDSLVERGLYKSRPEAVREFCREFVELHPPAGPISDTDEDTEIVPWRAGP